MPAKWAQDLVEEISTGEELPPVPILFTRRINRDTSAGEYDHSNGRISISVGNWEDDARLTVIHEMAHRVYHVKFPHSYYYALSDHDILYYRIFIGLVREYGKDCSTRRALDHEMRVSGWPYHLMDFRGYRENGLQFVFLGLTSLSLSLLAENVMDW